MKKGNNGKYVKIAEKAIEEIKEAAVQLSTWGEVMKNDHRIKDVSMETEFDCHSWREVKTLSAKVDKKIEIVLDYCPDLLPKAKEAARPGRVAQKLYNLHWRINSATRSRRVAKGRETPLYRKEDHAKMVQEMRSIVANQEIADGLVRG